jgi:hypothetical protein
MGNSKLGGKNVAGVVDLEIELIILATLNSRDIRVTTIGQISNSSLCAPDRLHKTGATVE